MRLYRKVIPKIARDIIRTLSSQNQIELEEGKAEEAELDLAAVMVEYLNTEEQLNRDAHDTLGRRGLGAERFSQIKKSIADVRNIKIGEEGYDYILQQMIEVLFNSSNIAEIFAEDNEIRKVLKDVIARYLSISEEVDKEARARLKNVREGSAEWDIEYPRMVAQIKKNKGL